MLDHYLSALEVAHGIEQGSTQVIVLVTETRRGHVPHRRLRGRAAGGRDDLGRRGSRRLRSAPAPTATPDGSYGFTYELARSLCLLGAAAAGVTRDRDDLTPTSGLEALRKRAEKVRRDGYRGMLAIHPAQVDVINEAFTPSAEEIAEAQEIVDLFAANPGVGTIGYKGAHARPAVSRPRAGGAGAGGAPMTLDDARRSTSASICARATASSGARPAASRRRWSRR